MSNSKKENKIKKTTIVIGAGASADFCERDLEKGKESQIAMPTGKTLVRHMVNFKDDFIGLFLLEYLKESGLKIQDETTLKSLRSLFLKSLKTNNGSIIFDTIEKRKKEEYESKDIDEKFQIKSAGKIYFNDLSRDSILELLNFLQKLLKEHGGRNEDANQFYELTIIRTSFKISQDELIEKISNKLHLQKYLDIGKLIKFYDPPSIDFFLSSIKENKINIKVGDVNSKTKDLLSAGKELIAYYLLKAEDKRTFNADNKIWYRWLRNEIVRIGKNEEEIINGLKNINIISFNYDRSLEAYLDEKVVGKDFLPYLDAIKNRIIYPYGSLHSFKDILEYGELKELLAMSENGDITSLNLISRLFLKKELESRVDDKKHGLFIIDEERSNFEEIKNNARAAISNEETLKLYFLGFAFLKENLDYLNLTKGRFLYDNNITRGSNIHKVKEFYYTNYSNLQKVRVNFNRVFQGIDGGKMLNNEENNRIMSPLGVYDALEKDFDLNFN